MPILHPTLAKSFEAATNYALTIHDKWIHSKSCEATKTYAYEAYDIARDGLTYCKYGLRDGCIAAPGTVWALAKHPLMIFVKAPEEHAHKAFRIRQKAMDVVFFRSGPGAWEKVPFHEPPAPGMVRVRWCPRPDRIMSSCFDRNGYLLADVPVGSSGELDLEIVRKMWGMENCTAIDPFRGTLFQPKNSDRLSPLAIRVLTEYEGCLRVKEEPSPDILRIRSCRNWMLFLVGILWPFLALLVILRHLGDFVALASVALSMVDGGVSSHA